MSSMSVQFHADPVETIDFVYSIANKLDLSIVAVGFPPFYAREMRRDEFVCEMAETKYHDVVLTVGRPALPARDQMHLFDMNSDSLSLTIERPEANGLRQSLFSASAKHPATWAVWKRARAQLNRITKTGVLITNPRSGECVSSRIGRYTQGAVLLAERGVTMLPIAGDNVISFPIKPPS